MAGNKLKLAEYQERIDKCFELRFNAEIPMMQKEWVKYCHTTYGDKSEQQYHYYWAQAKDLYDERWKSKLNKMLDPAMTELFSLLADDDAKIRQRAVDQIVKYTGNDINKIEADIKGEMNINLNWGDIIEGHDPSDEHK